MYLLVGIEHQSDKGFGINADAFKDSADKLIDIKHDDFQPQQHMPILYLYRHSIELYFKSMIYLFHQELHIPYGDNTEKPQIRLEDGKWRNLDNCHWLDALYWYWEKLLKEQKYKLSNFAPRGYWVIPEKLKAYIDEICKYDQDSTYFRYPFSKHNQTNQDKDKYSMEEVSGVQDILTKSISNKGSFSMIVSDSEGEVESIYTLNEGRFDGLLVTFKQAAGILSDYHFMTRMTLCDGY